MIIYKLTRGRVNESTSQQGLVVVDKLTKGQVDKG